MAELHGAGQDFTVNAVTFEEHTRTTTINVTVDLAESQNAADTWKEVLPGHQAWSVSHDGAADWADAKSDDTIFGRIATSTALTWHPNGGTTATTNPQYSGSAYWDNYTITAGMGDVITYSANWVGTGALTRAES